MASAKNGAQASFRRYLPSWNSRNSKVSSLQPLERIIDVNNETDFSVVTFSDAHLTHGTGEALRHAYHGDLESHFVDDDSIMRVRWHR